MTGISNGAPRLFGSPKVQLLRRACWSHSKLNSPSSSSSQLARRVPKISGKVATEVSTRRLWKKLRCRAQAGLPIVIPSARNLMLIGLK